MIYVHTHTSTTSKQKYANVTKAIYVDMLNKDTYFGVKRPIRSSIIKMITCNQNF